MRTPVDVVKIVRVKIIMAWIFDDAEVTTKDLEVIRRDVGMNYPTVQPSRTVALLKT